MRQEQTKLSIGDFIDLWYKVKQKGVQSIVSLLQVSGKARVASKWNTHITSADCWILPEIRMRWNEDSTGNADLQYEDYVMQKYLSQAQGLRMLSVGCGTGARERKWGRYEQFVLIDGIDIASQQVEQAKATALQEGLHHLQYFAGDFTSQAFEHAPYDVILFNSSLHHFADISGLLEHRVTPLLKPDGLLIVFEYAGPNRLQWRDDQLVFANKVLQALPAKFRVRFQSHSLKKKVYRPGLWRVKLIDPSEAVDSANLVPAIHQHFDIVEERRVRYDIAQLVLKDIAHHFLDADPEAKKWLQYVFDKEDEYCDRTGNRDMVFGVYRKKRVV